jgi:hypothetical protein
MKLPTSSFNRLPDPEGSPRVVVCLHRGPGVIGRLIRWQTRADYSHASLLFPGRGVIESREFKGVRALPALAPAPGEVIDTFSVRGLGCLQEQAVFDFAQAQLGKRYDWPMVFGFVSRSPIEGHQSEGRWFCSELVYAAFRTAGIELLRGIEPWEVSPGLLSYSPRLERQHTHSSEDAAPHAGHFPAI